MKLNDVRDVVVIGGGPAGSSCASFLAMKGHRVTVLEKEEFPREHVGESLLPFCYNLFDQLGVLDEMKKHYVRKPGVRFVDVNGVTKTTWCFNHVIHDHTYLSFQVARANFDKLLLDNSRRHGAHVKERTKVDKVNLNGPDGLVEVQATGPDGEKETHYARFLLDCSGRSTFLANMQGIKKKYPDLDRTALWTHYEVPGLSGGLEEGLSLIVYVGGEKKGWLWIFPLGPNWLTVGVVMNNTYLRSEKTRLQRVAMQFPVARGGIADRRHDQLDDAACLGAAAAAHQRNELGEQRRLQDLQRLPHDELRLDEPQIRMGCIDQHAVGDIVLAHDHEDVGIEPAGERGDTQVHRVVVGAGHQHSGARDADRAQRGLLDLRQAARA